eukprot:6692341-Karenia_brevis.AAC.1
MEPMDRLQKEMLELFSPSTVFTTADVREKLKNKRLCWYRLGLADKVRSAVESLVQAGLQVPAEKGEGQDATKRATQRSAPGRKVQAVRKRCLKEMEDDPPAKKRRLELAVGVKHFPSASPVSDETIAVEDEAAAADVTEYSHCPQCRRRWKQPEPFGGMCPRCGVEVAFGSRPDEGSLEQDDCECDPIDADDGQEVTVEVAAEDAH